MTHDAAFGGDEKITFRSPLSEGELKLSEITKACKTKKRAVGSPRVAITGIRKFDGRYFNVPVNTVTILTERHHDQIAALCDITSRR